MISEGSCDTEESNDAENSALITEINYSKYSKIENHYLMSIRDFFQKP